mmetsp:Transcript_34157/g.96798  ORF Transcript_34157/g.96798 Transcript_34157/m.96798 type:complete len:1143 (+) Transcript_34157:655-4083(+)|eukprot:CAMPEP_0117666450 /NCGR_PEP_ID=MMETSP0804-20121206/10383_1 /TAXON_ID=1074897 /ORGANISM="Tetraselmis astigmatica, Strain CCMP880" /LENGTH=1142 /DNA_ID=CAMNT_0005473997 /DNA_START=654 /DNA_END=4082 /DNA_ORIENTATION=-
MVEVPEVTDVGETFPAPGLAGSLADQLPPPSPAISSSGGSSRVDRLLRERMRKSSSIAGMYSETAPETEHVQVPVDREVGERERLVIIANRLPLTASRTPSGGWKLEPSSGGLASAMLGLDNFDITWIGWPGVFVPPGNDRDLLTTVLCQKGYHPVFLTERHVDLFYNGFCNQVLWQLFHYVPLNLDSKLSQTRTLQMQWQAYKDVNQAFADVSLGIYKRGDIVWCQDYHLMLLPALLKEAVPRMKVGFFLHTPFPSSEIYRTLPVREDLLRATLKADLIGFHTYDYARHFVSACTRILGFEGTPEGVEDDGQLTRVAAFPIGIDPERFTTALRTAKVKSSITELMQRYSGRKVMLGVDRLDMIKGIPQKLLAYEKFLEEHPDWRNKVLLVQIAVPTRTDVPEYQQLRSLVHEIVGRINGKFGTLTHVPIHHLDRGLSFEELCALYAVTDVALVTSLRDGMNLVSYEYVACQSDNAGVLLLSEFAGAAQSLGAGAILVNPWNITDMAAAIRDALTMSDEERRERHRQNNMHVSIHTAQTWADTFISELNDTHVENEQRIRRVPPALPVDRAVEDFRLVTGRRLLVLGYNATLTQAEEAPRQPKRHFDQIKAQTQVNPDVYHHLCKLAAHPLITVVVFSGSDRMRLMETFEKTPNVWLAAENGVFMRPPYGPESKTPPEKQWVTSVPSINNDWKESVQLVFEYFCERTPRSFVEVRESSLVWNYKYADVEFGRLQARDLLQHLWTGPISNAPVDIVQGARSVEARPVSVSKGSAMQKMIELMQDLGGPDAVNFDYVMCMGHFLGRDENLFSLFEGKRLGPVSKQDHQLAHHSSPGSPQAKWKHSHMSAAASQRGGGQASGSKEGGQQEPAAPSRSILANMMRSRGLDGGHGRPRPGTGAAPGSLYRQRQAIASHQELATGSDGGSSGSGERQHQGNEPMVSPPTGPATPSSTPAASPSNDKAASCGPWGPSSSGSSEGEELMRECNLQRLSLKTARPRLDGSFQNVLPESPRPLCRLPPKCLYTITVGRTQSNARYCLGGSKDVSAILERFVGLLPELPFAAAAAPPPPPPASPSSAGRRDNSGAIQYHPQSHPLRHTIAFASQYQVASDRLGSQMRRATTDNSDVGISADGIPQNACGGADS